MSVVDHWVEGEDEQEIDQKKNNIYIYIQIQKIMIQFVQTPFNVFDAVLYLEYAKDVGELGGGGRKRKWKWNAYLCTAFCSIHRNCSSF